MLLIPAEVSKRPGVIRLLPLSLTSYPITALAHSGLATLIFLQFLQHLKFISNRVLT